MGKFTKKSTMSYLANEKAKKIVELTKLCISAEYNKAISTSFISYDSNDKTLEQLKTRINILISDLQKDLECAI